MPFARIIKIGSVLPIGAAVIWSEHPGNHDFKWTGFQNGSNQSVFSIIIDVAEILVFHLYYWMVNNQKL